jgi:hypothetical protein
MAKATGKRGHRTKADEVLSRKATQHHDFVGQAEPDRERSRTVEEERIRRDHEELEKEVVQEMAEQLETVSGVARPQGAESARGSQAGAERAQERPPIEIPTSWREGIDLIRQRGPELLEALRAKAEQRLEQMPAPFKSAVRLTERAMGMVLWPVRAGAHLVGRVLETPLALVRIVIARRTA